MILYHPRNLSGVSKYDVDVDVDAKVLRGTKKDSTLYSNPRRWKNTPGRCMASPGTSGLTSVDNKQLHFKPSTKDTFERNFRIDPAWPRFHELGPSLSRWTRDRYFRELVKLMKIKSNDKDTEEEGYSPASEEEVREWECASQKLERAALFADDN